MVTDRNSALAIDEEADPELSTQTQETPSLPALEPAFQLMLFAYQEYDASHKSLLTRAGVGLGFAAAALVGTSSLWPRTSTEALAVWGLIALLGAAFLGAGVIFLAVSLLTDVAVAGFSTQELLATDWKRTAVDFYLQQLSNLKQGIENSSKRLDCRARRFDVGVASALIGLLLLMVSKALHTLVFGRL